VITGVGPRAAVHAVKVSSETRIIPAAATADNHVRGKILLK